MVAFSDLGGPQPASATTSCFLEVMDRTYDSGSSLCHDILCTICRFCPHIIRICLAFVPNHASSLGFFSNLWSHLLSMNFASVLDNTLMFFDTCPAKPSRNIWTTEFSSLGPPFLTLNVFLLTDIISGRSYPIFGSFLWIKMNLPFCKSKLLGQPMPNQVGHVVLWA